MNQREVHTHTDGFKERAARGAARGIRNIVLVGEMRDLETGWRSRSRRPRPATLVFGTPAHDHRRLHGGPRDRPVSPTDRQAQIRIMLSESLRGVIAADALQEDRRRPPVAAPRGCCLSPAPSAT